MSRVKKEMSRLLREFLRNGVSRVSVQELPKKVVSQLSTE